MCNVFPEFNLCAGNLDKVTRNCELLHKKVILPCLESPHPMAMDMAGRMLRGMEHFNPFIRPTPFTACMLNAFKSDSHRYVKRKSIFNMKANSNE